jgi:ribonuclease-3
MRRFLNRCLDTGRKGFYADAGGLRDMLDLLSVERAIGLTFVNPSLLEQSLVHPSYLNENSGFSLPSNERLEFLGDAVLGFVVAEKLYQDFPNLSEGKMTRLRSALVNGETLADLAFFLGLGDHLYLGRGEEASGGRTKRSNLAHVLEAIMGAILLDQGLGAAKDFILRLLEKELQKAISKRWGGDYKSWLQEIVQARERLTPIYQTIEVGGPEHERNFWVEVSVGYEVLAKGKGKSKRAAEREAARAALEGLLGETIIKEE